MVSIKELFFFFCKAGQKSKKLILAINLCNSEKKIKIGLHGGEHF